ncbi:unnamed protein product [Amoebophrya sp. A120]|nr:unnamed protein product [Amoebophrya sp. A120]|eukprot:GSA120T00016438001.1
MGVPVNKNNTGSSPESGAAGATPTSRDVIGTQGQETTTSVNKLPASTPIGSQHQKTKNYKPPGGVVQLPASKSPGTVGPLAARRSKTPEKLVRESVLANKQTNRGAQRSTSTCRSRGENKFNPSARTGVEVSSRAAVEGRRVAGGAAVVPTGNKQSNVVDLLQRGGEQGSTSKAGTSAVVSITSKSLGPISSTASGSSTSSPRRQAARQRWCYERVNALHKKRDQINLFIAERKKELEAIAAKMRTVGPHMGTPHPGAGTSSSDGAGAAGVIVGSGNIKIQEPPADRDGKAGAGAGSTAAQHLQGGTSNKQELEPAPTTTNLNKKKELSDVTRERAIKRAEYDRNAMEIEKVQAECRNLERDCLNLQRSSEKWKQKTEPDAEISETKQTEEFLYKKQSLESEKDLDERRKISLESGLCDGIMVREKLQQDITKEREKLKLLEAAWADKQKTMTLERLKFGKKMELVMQEERALMCQREVILRQIEEFTTNTSSNAHVGDHGMKTSTAPKGGVGNGTSNHQPQNWKQTEMKFVQLQDLASSRTDAKQQMFEQLRNLQEVHQKKNAEFLQYEKKVEELQQTLFAKQSQWRLNHIRNIDDRVAFKRNRSFVQLQTGVGETLFASGNAFGDGWEATKGNAWEATKVTAAVGGVNL